MDVTLGDPGKQRRIGELVGDESPRAVVAASVIAAGFEFESPMAPHRSTGGTGGHGTEDVDVERARMVRKLDDPLRAGSVEGAADLADSGDELPPFVSGG